jgi:hypothetical protein
MCDIPKMCKEHSLQVTNICTDEACDDIRKFLCDLCSNSSHKGHNYIISIKSLKNNFYEKIIEKHEEINKNHEHHINEIANNIGLAMENQLLLLSEYITNFLKSAKNELYDKIENIKESYIEETSIWTKMKVQYEKCYIKSLLSNGENNEIPYETEADKSKNIKEKDEPSDNNFSQHNQINENLKSLLGVINYTIEKQIHYSDPKNDLVAEFSSKLKDNINEEIKYIQKDLVKSIEEKLKFPHLQNNNSCNKSRLTIPKININQQYSPINYQSNQVFSPENKSNNQSFFSNKKTPNVNYKKDCISSKRQNNLTEINQAVKITIANVESVDSPSVDCTNNKSNVNFHSNSVTNFHSNHSKNATFNPDNFSFNKIRDVFPEKKGEWYSLEYIEEFDYVVCGYQSGEIVIFKESDHSLIRTYRPRFKRVRKIIYSPENSSLFASYDDGYIVVINLTNFKISSYKMCSSQIYTMSILPNHNAIIFGGVDKKILYSYIINLNKVLLFYESGEGDIQNLFYDDQKDMLVSSMRKNTILFFKFSTNEMFQKIELNPENDCCGMTIKKFQEDLIFICGYFLIIHQFKLLDNKVEYVGTVQIINNNFLHVYDFIKLDDNFILISTFDDGVVALIDIKNKISIKTFENSKGVIQIKIIKQSLYITSHCECLKKIIL